MGKTSPWAHPADDIEGLRHPSCTGEWRELLTKLWPHQEARPRVERPDDDYSPSLPLSFWLPLFRAAAVFSAVVSSPHNRRCLRMKASPLCWAANYMLMPGTMAAPEVSVSKSRPSKSGVLGHSS